MINGEWIIVDPTRVNWIIGSTGFNYSPWEYEIGRNLNISYVFAEYPDGKREDITYRYTNLSKIIFECVDYEGNPTEGVVIKIYSNNWKNGLYTKLNCTTDSSGKCSVGLGGGSYKVVAKN